MMMMMMTAVVGSMNTKLHYSTLAIDLSTYEGSCWCTTYYLLLTTRREGEGGEDLWIVATDRQASWGKVRICRKAEVLDLIDC